MKPNFEYGEAILANEDAFQDAFFRRFNLRKGAAPFRLDQKISRDYLFPIFYADVTCAMGIFMCDYAKARSILPDPRLKPVRMTRGRSLVLFSCYEYRNVMHLKPYNEMAMMIPVMADPAVNLPVLPMVTPFFGNFGYYAVGILVTSKENALRGAIWGLRKTLGEVDLIDRGDECMAIAREESGAPCVELHVPKSGRVKEFDVKTKLYAQLDGAIVRSEVCFKGEFRVTKYTRCLVARDLEPDRSYLKIGNTATAGVLHSLDIERHPFQLRYAERINSTLDLPDPDFRLTA